MKVYLCGPINGRSDNQCKCWREYAKSMLSETIDPMARDYRGVEDQRFVEIVESDKSDILKCDALLVNYDGPSVGTSMEILFAWERGKQIVVVVANNIKISPWLRYHATHLTSTFEEAFEFLTKK